MEIDFLPGEHGWIEMKIGTNQDELVSVELSYVFDTFLDLHKFFYYLEADRTGHARVKIDEEGIFTSFIAEPLDVKDSAKVEIVKQRRKGSDQQLSFVVSRSQAAATYRSSFQKLVDGQNYGGFDKEELFVEEFNRLFKKQ